MSVFEALNVMYFVHHFPTHSVVWEVWETDYASIDDIPVSLREGMFEGADGKVYHTFYPSMYSRKRAEDYCDVSDNEFTRYAVVEISNETPKAPITFQCVSYYRGNRDVEEYGTLDAMKAQLLVDAEPDYRNAVFAWANNAERGSDFTQMNGAVKEIWTAK